MDLTFFVGFKKTKTLLDFVLSSSSSIFFWQQKHRCPRNPRTYGHYPVFYFLKVFAYLVGICFGENFEFPAICTYEVLSLSLVDYLSISSSPLVKAYSYSILLDEITI